MRQARWFYIYYVYVNVVNATFHSHDTSIIISECNTLHVRFAFAFVDNTRKLAARYHTPLEHISRKIISLKKKTRFFDKKNTWKLFNTPPWKSSEPLKEWHMCNFLKSMILQVITCAIPVLTSVVIDPCHGGDAWHVFMHLPAWRPPEAVGKQGLCGQTTDAYRD